MRVGTLAILALAACQPSGAGSTGPVASPVGVTWKLVELNGQPAGLGANGQPASLILDSRGSKANGYAGCNQFSGTYTLADDALVFGPLAMTRMACAEGDALESGYTKALAATTSQRVAGGKLQLLAGSTVVARFTQ